MAITNNALVVPAPSAAPTNALSLPEGDIIDEVEPIYIAPDLTWLWITLGVLALAALIFYAWRRWRRSQEREAAPPPGPPPDRVALDALLEALRLIHEPEPFCTRVSSIVRVYLEEQFDLRAPERTTEEFLVELQSSPQLNEAQKESLGGFLEQCDLVKFARHEPTESELRALHDAARRLVEDTRLNRSREETEATA